jgi:hypothetical protein
VELVWSFGGVGLVLSAGRGPGGVFRAVAAVVSGGVMVVSLFLIPT